MSDYRVSTTFSTTTNDTGLPQYPDNTISLSFDSTESTINEMCRQFAQFLSSIGYVLQEGKTIGVVNDYELI